MGEFSEDPANNFDYITASDRMSYSFNVYNEGNVLEIVSLGCEYNALISNLNVLLYINLNLNYLIVTYLQYKKYSLL